MPAYTLKIRCWFCRDIFSLELTPNEQGEQLIRQEMTCPECHELGQLSLQRHQLSDIATVNGQAPSCLEEIPAAQLAVHVFGTKQV